MVIWSRTIGGNKTIRSGLLIALLRLTFLKKIRSQSFLYQILWSSFWYKYRQSHYRKVPQWEIFMEQELRFGMHLGRLSYITEKKTFGRIMSNFWGGFFQLFLGKKKDIENIYIEKKMRSLILTHSVQAKMPQALDRAGKYFQDLKKSQKSVPADFR